MAEITIPPKKMMINFADTCCTGSHMGIGQWKRPEDNSRFKDRLDYYVWLAKTAERGKITSIFFADTYGFFDTYQGKPDAQFRGGSHTGTLDPVAIVAAMAMVTEKVNFAITGNTTYLRPFLLARTWSTLDHITNGRIGLNMVTGFQESAAKQMGYDTQMSHDERYVAADEYMELVYQLWEKCWEDGCQTWNVEPEQAYDPNKVHRIEFEGKYHKFSGYGQAHPSPQRTPVLFQAGNSTAGIAFAGKHAEALYCGGAHIPPLKAYTTKIRASARAAGRDPSNIKAFAAITPVIGRTEEEAWEKFRIAEASVSWEGGLAAFCGYSGLDLSPFPVDEPLEFSEEAMASAPMQNFLRNFKTIDPEKKWTPRMVGHSFAFGTNVPKPVGTAKQVADFLEKWLNEADVDGFNLSYLSNPGSFEDIVDLLVPELQSRGLMWQDYPSSTFRENLQLTPGDPYLPSSHPAAKYKWDKEYAVWEGETKKEVQINKTEDIPAIVDDLSPGVKVPNEEIILDLAGKGEKTGENGEKELFEEKVISLPVVDIAA